MINMMGGTGRILKMEGIGMKYHLSQVEKWAERAWIKYNLEAPVDLSFLCSSLGIPILRRDFKDNTCDTSAIYGKRVDGKCLILVNILDPLTHQRFSIAHEIAHHLFMMRDSVKPGTGRVCIYKHRRLPGSDNDMENACNHFAAALLMPHELLIRWYYELEHNKEYRMEILMSRFGVSRSALIRRLRELHLPVNQWEVRATNIKTVKWRK